MKTDIFIGQKTTFWGIWIQAIPLTSHSFNSGQRECTPWILRSCDRTSWQILIIKPTRCTNFSNLFWSKTLHVSDSSSVHHQEFLTVYTAMVYVIQVCWQLASRIRMFQLSANLYGIYHCCVYSEKTHDDGQRNCPKHVGSYSKKEFDKLLHLAGFIVRSVRHGLPEWFSTEIISHQFSCSECMVCAPPISSSLTLLPQW